MIARYRCSTCSTSNEKKLDDCCSNPQPFELDMHPIQETIQGTPIVMVEACSVFLTEEERNLLGLLLVMRSLTHECDKVLCQEILAKLPKRIS